jgi:hypothetical protein
MKSGNGTSTTAFYADKCSTVISASRIGEIMPARRSHSGEVTRDGVMFSGTLTPEITEELGKPGSLIAIPDQHLDLLKFVARTIRTINVNGRAMTTKCRLCPQAHILKEPCRHDEIFKLAGLAG